jgi:hypothetical protein
VFKLLRFYAAFSLLALVATAGLLTWFYRAVTSEGMVTQAKRDNLDMAHIALNSIEPLVVPWLADRRSGGAAHAVPPQVDSGIRTLLSDGNVVRVTLYDRRGRVAFSTDGGQSGRDLGGDAELLPVLAGEVRSELVLRGARAVSEEGGSEPGNVMQTRLPVRTGPSGPVQGVFEMRVDVDQLVDRVRREALMVFWGALSILAVLYWALLAIVRHAGQRIQLQHRAMRERSATVAALAGQMLKAEDARRREMAFELHERVAQTLAAAKLQAEAGQGPDSGAVIPLLRDAIEEVRAIAADLRPASLDELGLLPTLQSMLRDVERRHPDLQVTSRISVLEDDVRATLKGIIYRIASAVLGAMTQDAGAGTLRLCLVIEEGDLLVLRIRGRGEQSSGIMEQLTTLSGGAFDSAPDGNGGTVLRAAWSCHPTSPGALA